MATLAKKALRVLEYARTKSIVAVQRRFRTKFRKDPPAKNRIKQLYEKLQRDGCLCIAKRAISLRRVWAKMDYRLDVCRVTKGGHMEHLLDIQSKLGEFLFLSVCRVFPSFAPFKCTNFL
jgi:hypothetical protein